MVTVGAQQIIKVPCSHCLTYSFHKGDSYNDQRKTKITQKDLKHRNVHTNCILKQSTVSTDPLERGKGTIDLFRHRNKKYTPRKKTLHANLSPKSKKMTKHSKIRRGIRDYPPTADMYIVEQCRYLNCNKYKSAPRHGKKAPTTVLCTKGRKNDVNLSAITVCKCNRIDTKQVFNNSKAQTLPAPKKINQSTENKRNKKIYNHKFEKTLARHGDSPAQTCCPCNKTGEKLEKDFKIKNKATCICREVQENEALMTEKSKIPKPKNKSTCLCPSMPEIEVLTTEKSKIPKLKNKATCLCHVKEKQLDPVDYIYTEGPQPDKIKKIKNITPEKFVDIRDKQKKTNVRKDKDKKDPIEQAGAQNINSSETDTTISKLVQKITFLCHKYPQKFIAQKKRTGKLDDEKNQTGDPLIEIQLGANDLCVLNSNEIRKKMITLSNSHEKSRSCICPSHTKRQKYYRKRNLCRKGICEKAFKNKKVNVTCTCPKMCTDATCDGKLLYKNSKRDDLKALSLPVKYNNPMFEVQFDSNSMCVVNPQEVEKNIEAVKMSNKILAAQVCPEGICQRLKKRGFTCKCIEKKRKPEEVIQQIKCSDKTCEDKNKLLGISPKKTKDTLNIKSRINCCSQFIAKSTEWIVPFKQKIKNKNRTDRHRRQGRVRIREGITIRTKTKSTDMSNKPLRNIDYYINKALQNKGAQAKIMPEPRHDIKAVENVDQNVENNLNKTENKGKSKKKQMKYAQIKKLKKGRGDEKLPKSNFIPNYLRQCSDTTCEKKNPKLVMRLDSDSMCILNAEEVEEVVSPETNSKLNKNKQTEHNKQTKHRKNAKTKKAKDVIALKNNEAPRIMDIPIDRYDPLLEIRLDSDSMCVINPHEIREAVMNAPERTHIPEEDAIFMKEKNKEPESNTSLLSMICSIFRKKLKDKMEKKPIKPNEVQEMKSLLGCFCSQIRTKSANWTSKNRQQSRRRKSGRLHKRKDLNINTTSQNMNGGTGGRLCVCGNVVNTVADSDSVKNRYKYTIHRLSEGRARRRKSVYKRSGLSLPPQKIPRDKPNVDGESCVCCVCKKVKKKNESELKKQNKCRQILSDSFSCLFRLCQPNKEKTIGGIKTRTRKSITPSIKSQKPDNKINEKQKEKQMEKEKKKEKKKEKEKEIEKEKEKEKEKVKTKQKQKEKEKEQKEKVKKKEKKKEKEKEKENEKEKQKEKEEEKKKEIQKEQEKIKEKERQREHEKLKEKEKLKLKDYERKKLEDKLGKEKERAKIKEMKEKKLDEIRSQNKLIRQQMRKEKEMTEARKKQMESDEKKLAKEMKKKQKLESIKRVKQYLREEKEMQALSKVDTTTDTNCLADCVVGSLVLALEMAIGLTKIIFKFISEPKMCIKYIKQRYRDPRGTLFKFSQWFGTKWRRQKFKIMKTIKGSYTLGILLDTILDSALFDAFAPKGATLKERMIIEGKSRRRKQRIRKRENQALYGCRHMLLTTLKKTPCLWVYHICPNHYPQFLSLLAFFKNFSNMVLFVLAVFVWTPCILAVEFCRAVLCCFMCN